MKECLSLSDGSIFCPQEEVVSPRAPLAMRHCNGPSQEHLEVIRRNTAPSSKPGLLCVPMVSDKPL